MGVINRGYEQGRFVSMAGSGVARMRRAQNNLAGKHAVLRELGVGTNDPEKAMHILSEQSGGALMVERIQTNANPASVILRKSRGDLDAKVVIADDDNLGDFLIEGYVGANNGYQTVGDFRFEVDGSVTDAAYGAPVRMVMKLASGSGLVERLRLDSSGNMGIGMNDPSTKLTVEGAVTLKEQGSADADTAAYGQMWVKTATPNQLYFTTDAGNDIQITSGTALASTYSAGDGLDLTGTTFSTDLKSNGGLVIESTELAVDLGASSITGTVAVGDGGSGQTSYTNGQLLIGNTTGNTLAKATLTAGSSNITITNGSGTITIDATNTTYSPGTLLDVSGTTFNVDLTEATEAVMANGDYILFLDATDSFITKKEAIADVATLFAGDGLAASASVMAVNVDDSTIETNSDAIRIKDDGVTYAKIQNVTATNRILGRDTGGAGVIEELDKAAVLTMLNVADGATAGGETNEYSFKTITFGGSASAQSDVVADADDDTLTLVAGANVTITTTADQITFVATDTNTMGAGFVLEDGDGTEVTITESKEVKFVEGTGIDIDWTDVSPGSDADPYDLTFTVNLEGTELISTGESGGSKFLRENGDGTCGWETVSGSGDITSVVAGVGLSGGAASGDATLTVDFSEFSTVTPASGDFLATLDSDGAQEQKTAISALATLFAGTASSTGLSASSSVLSVTDLHNVGVDGAANQVVTDDGDGTVTSEAKALVDGAKLTIGNATAEDAMLAFDGHAQAFHVALDDTADDLVIGVGTAAGTTTAIAINEHAQVSIVDLFAANVAGTFGTFADGDATPSVATGNLWKHHASTQAITMFDDGVAGQTIHVISTAAITYDVTSTNLKGGSADIVTASGDITSWFFDGTNWYLLQFMDVSADHSSVGGGSGASLSGSTNNTVATVTGSNALIGEANMTFDGSALTITGNVFVDGGADINQVKIQGHSTQTASPFLVENSGGTDVFEITNTGQVIGASGAVFKGNSFLMGSSGGSTNFIHATDAINLNFRNHNAGRELQFDFPSSSGTLNFRTHDGTDAVTMVSLDSAGVWTHNVAMVATADAVFKGDTEADLFVVDAGAETVGVGVAAGSMRHKFDCRGSRGYATSLKTDDYTLTIDDAIVYADASGLGGGEDLTITLPTISKGRIYEVYRRDDGGSGATVTVTAPSGTYLNGTDGGSVGLSNQYDGVRVVGIHDTDDWIAHEMTTASGGGGGGMP